MITLRIAIKKDRIPCFACSGHPIAAGHLNFKSA